jgi:hypothetical protein
VVGQADVETLPTHGWTVTVRLFIAGKAEMGAMVPAVGMREEQLAYPACSLGHLEFPVS